MNTTMHLGGNAAQLCQLVSTRSLPPSGPPFASTLAHLPQPNIHLPHYNPPPPSRTSLLPTPLRTPNRLSPAPNAPIPPHPRAHARRTSRIREQLALQPPLQLQLIFKFNLKFQFKFKFARELELKFELERVFELPRPRAIRRARRRAQLRGCAG